MKSEPPQETPHPDQAHDKQTDKTVAGDEPGNKQRQSRDHARDEAGPRNDQRESNKWLDTDDCRDVTKIRRDLR